MGTVKEQKPPYGSDSTLLRSLYCFKDLSMLPGRWFCRLQVSLCINDLCVDSFSCVKQRQGGGIAVGICFVSVGV